MALQKLYKAGAFGPGSDLWIIPTGDQSHWNFQVDWYLNFLLTKARKHNSQSLPEGLLKVIKENELDLQTEFNADHKPLLIASEKHFPNKQVVELPKSESAEEWLKKAYDIWNNFGSPTLRIFLPQFVTDETISQYWPGQATDPNVTLVPSTLN